MCGLCGVVNVRHPAATDVVAAMSGLMVRRGPDDSGSWSDPYLGAHLGFRRLAVLDSSPAGHQPMVSGDGRSVLVFNGEIYNWPELRRLVADHGVQLRGGSDSEVLLEWLNLRGVAGLDRLNGMFALALLDRPTGGLLLARDHAGIKPLHIATEPGGPGVAFSSRYDALFLTGWPDLDEVDPDALSLYLELTHVPAPYGLHRRTEQVAAGCYVRVDRSGIAERGRWWYPPGPDEPDLSGDAAKAAVQEALDRAVRRQLVADVPVGVFLSSGVDSPLVAATASRFRPGLPSFTMGSDHNRWQGDERAGARRFADALDLPNQAGNATAEDALAAVEESVEAAHEPFGDYSILPTLLLSRLARASVTVALSGDGGDELFFGYERPKRILARWRLWRLPQTVRLALFRARRLPGVPGVDEMLTSPSPAAALRWMHSRLTPDQRRALAPDLPVTAGSHLYRDPARVDPGTLAALSRQVEFDLQLQRVLKKVDMASMHHSLEVRVPLLDREVIDQAYRVDLATHQPATTRKAVLVDLLARRVPRQIISPGKVGFGAPLGDWLNGILRDRVTETFMAPDLYLDEFLDRGALLELWEEHHRDGELAWPLWALISLQWWGDRVRRLVAAAGPGLRR